MSNDLSSIKSTDQVAENNTQKKHGLKAALAVVLTVLLFFGSQIIGIQIIASIFYLFGFDQEQLSSLVTDNGVVQFIILLGIQVLLVCLIILFLRWRQLNIRDVLLLKRPPNAGDVGYAVVTYGLYFLTLIAVTIAASQLIPALDINQSQDLGIATPETNTGLILIYASVVILPAVAEELLFRGFLMHFLKRFGGIVVAYIGTSILFGLAHLEYENLNWIAMLDTTVFSVFLIYISQKRQSLWPAIFLHAIKNSIAFYVLFIQV